MNSKVEFMFAAIADTQATIRAIDIKVATLIVGVLAPLANTNRIFFHLDHVGLQSPQCLCMTIVVLFLLAWLLALAALVRAIGAIDNPSQHIINTGSCKGTFYRGGLYTLSIVDAFLDRDIIKASTDLPSCVAQIPATETEIENELVFEHMKLAFIRDVKLNRLKWGLRFALIWLALGIGIFLHSKYIV